jgi:peptidoglycan/LPS O-acetylase OafA/YrhL
MTLPATSPGSKGIDSVAESRNSWLDLCRSLAILLVLLSHGRHFLTPAWDAASAFRIGGFLGVELFFVLSGFLIGGIANRSFSQAGAGEAWVGRFVLRRWLRTLPNYYLFLIVNAFLIATAITPGHLGDLIPFAFFAQNLAWPGPPPFGEAWSLAVEEVFYLIFPLSLYALGRIEPDRRKVFLTVTIALLVIPLLARWGAVSMTAPTWDGGIRKVVVFRLDALISGVLAGWLVQEFVWLERTRTALVGVLAAAVVLTVVALFFVFESVLDESSFLRIWLFPLASLGCALTLVAGINSLVSNSMIARIANAGARQSYALYLAHMPVFHLIMHFSGPTQQGDTAGAVSRWLLFLTGSLLVSALVERSVERPILAWRDHAIPR